MWDDVLLLVVFLGEQKENEQTKFIVSLCSKNIADLIHDYQVLLVYYPWYLVPVVRPYR